MQATKIVGGGGNTMKKLAERLGALAVVLTLTLTLGLSLTPAGFNNMVINTVAKVSNSK